MKEAIEKIKHEMLTQDNRSTSDPIFIVVEDRKVYGVDIGTADGRERKEDYDNPLCEKCEAMADSNRPDYPDDCEDCPSDAFISYRVENDVPNLRAGFFFTAQACNEHIEANRHHYNKTAKSYAISAYHNEELKTVMKMIINFGDTHCMNCMCGSGNDY